MSLALVPSPLARVTSLRPRTVSADEAVHELLRRSGQGDEAAFARLYDVMIPLVMGVARLLTTPDDVVALAERACVDVWRMSPGYSRTGAGPLSWITARVEQAARLQSS